MGQIDDTGNARRRRSERRGLKLIPDELLVKEGSTLYHHYNQTLTTDTPF